MMGIGVDIISMKRMAETLDRSGGVFLRKAFTPAEIAQGEASENPTAFFATAWAAKEATFKALVLTWDQGIDLRDMEVARGPAGEPLMNLSGNIERIAREKGCARVLISLSYESEHAVAAAMLDDHSTKGRSKLPKTQGGGPIKGYRRRWKIKQLFPWL